VTHLSDEDVVELHAGRLAPSAWRKAVRHLLRGCLVCVRKYAFAAGIPLDELQWPLPESAYDAPFKKARAAVRRAGRRHAKDRELYARNLDALRNRPGGMSSLSPREAYYMHGWGMAEAYLEESFALRYSDPKRMLSYAQTAADVADHTPLKESGPSVVLDLRARAWAEYGNALRLNDRLVEAEAAFAKALSWMEQGSGDLLLNARVLDLLASLRSHQRRLPEALQLLDTVHGLYEEIGDTQLAGRALVSKASNVLYDGRPQEAVGVLRQGLALLDPHLDPQLWNVARFNLIDALVDSREVREARRLLLESGLWQAFAEEPLSLLKLRWIEARIQAGLGRLPTAEQAFQEVREGFKLRDSHYEAALVGLDLADSWLRQGKAGQVHELAEEMYETFERLGIHSEATLALSFLEVSCRMGTVSLLIVEWVRSYLARAQHEPDRRFSFPA
jgi:tetratricopeptide (TPR) repeat protein